jgi:hypothetical protein
LYTIISESCPLITAKDIGLMYNLTYLVLATRVNAAVVTKPTYLARVIYRHFKDFACIGRRDGCTHVGLTSNNIHQRSLRRAFCLLSGQYPLEHNMIDTHDRTMNTKWAFQILRPVLLGSRAVAVHYSSTINATKNK